MIVWQRALLQKDGPSHGVKGNMKPWSLMRLKIAYDLTLVMLVMMDKHILQEGF